MSDLSTEEKLEELEALFDLQWKREREIFARWRQEGKLGALELPDYGHTIEMLGDEIEKLAKLLKKAHDIMDDHNAEKFRTCQWCDEHADYDGDGLKHKDSCILVEIRRSKALQYASS